MQLDLALAENRMLLADGAMGTNLFAMGLAPGASPEQWNDSHPDRVQRLHRDFVQAGADLILTNSFGGNIRRLALHDLSGHCHALNVAAARLAREVALEAGRPVVVAGSVGPTGDVVGPEGRLTEAEAVRVFAEQIRGLAEGGVDVIWIETMWTPTEMRAAARAATRIGLPFTITASFDAAGLTMTGLPPGRFARVAAELDPPALAIGANCGTGPAELLASVMELRDHAPGVRLIAKASVGVPARSSDRVDGLRTPTGLATPAMMGDYARMAVDAGASIVGGCCGTTVAHVAAMRQALDRHVKGPPPLIDDIVARIGPVAGQSGPRTA